MKTINLIKSITTFMLLVAVVISTNAHTPGPNYIYKCPKCSTLLSKGSNASGNTFGATFYSDGKMIAPMLPEFPNLTKCPKCDTILWLSDLKEIGTCDEWEKKCKPEWKNADKVGFIGINDLLRFLDLDTVKHDTEKELFVRQKIWWSFNDRLRGEKEIFEKESDEALWKQNCQRLIELFDTTDINQKIMTAELYRNLKEFDVCMQLINSIEDKKMMWLTEKFKIECDNKNRWLVKLR